jgi:hypothetical protein
MALTRAVDELFMALDVPEPLTADKFDKVFAELGEDKVRFRRVHDSHPCAAVAASDMMLCTRMLANDCGVGTAVAGAVGLRRPVALHDSLLRLCNRLPAHPTRLPRCSLTPRWSCVACTVTTNC